MKQKRLVILLLVALLLLTQPISSTEVRLLMTLDGNSSASLLGDRNSFRKAIAQLVHSCVCTIPLGASSAVSPCVEVEKIRGANVVLRSEHGDVSCPTASAWTLLATIRDGVSGHQLSALGTTPDTDDVDTFHNWTAGTALLDKWIVTLTPQDLFVETINIGTSIEGRSIPCICIVASSKRFSYPPTVLVVGGHHAREWISVEAPLRMVRMLLEGFARNSRIRALLHGARMCIVPNLNPDGYVFSWGPGWAGSIPKRMWRKNRRGTGPGGSGGDVYGVDLNRNYNVDWLDDAGSSSRAVDETYRGTAALSEPEVQSLYSFVLSQHGAVGSSNRQRIAGFVSIHSYGNDIMFPLGYGTNSFGPNEAFLRALGNKMQGAIWNVTGNSYDVMKAADSYTCSGDAVDAVYTASGFTPSFTIETRPGLQECCGFNLKPRFIESATLECFTAVAVLAEYVVAATSQGIDNRAWAHHRFNATFAPLPVTNTSHFTSADRGTDDLSRFIDEPRGTDGQRRRTKWLVIRLDSVQLLNASTSIQRSQNFRLRVATVMLTMLQCPEIGLEIQRAAYLPSWSVFSCVVALTAPSLDSLSAALVRLSEIVESTSGPSGRPQIGLL
jgi:murein tripeptide amidase MpaA